MGAVPARTSRWCGSRRLLVVVAAAVLALASCGDDDTTAAPDGQRPVVVVSTSVLGDVVENLAGEQVDVVTVMPAGTDPHEFQASARQAQQMRQADALVVNGGGLEEGLLDVIDSARADGVPVHEAISAVEPLAQSPNHDHDTGEDHGHDHEGEEPHFFTDPLRTADAVEGLSEFLAGTVEGIDVEALQAAADDYVAELESLHAEIEELLAGIEPDQRVLVTGHRVFDHFAERYGFEVVGAVVPSGTTADAVSAGDLAALAETVRDLGVPAVFTDTSSGDDLAQTLADEVGDVEVVELYSESLGEPGSGAETYLAMMRTNAERIAAALG